MTTLRPRPVPSSCDTLTGHETAGELRGLTGLRIVAAAWVVFFHFHFTPLPGVAEVVAVFGPLLTAGALGVDLFFVLSGFVIAYTYLDQLGPALRASSTARFVWARACRLWPAYALVFHLFGLWLAARWYFGSDGEIAFQAVQPVLSVGEYAQQLVMVQLWDNPRFDGASWVGSTWSISAEWLAYLLFPPAALVFFRLRRLPAAVLGAGAMALMAPMAWAYLATGSPYFDWSWLVRILCGFGAGVLAYLAVRRLRSTGAVAAPAVRTAASVLAAALPVLIAAGLLAGERLGPGRGGAVLVLFPLLVGALAVADRGPAMVLSAPWAVAGGRISYCLYLVHIPMLEVYWLALRKFDALGPHTWAAHLTGLAVVASTFVVAAGLFRLVEEPARRRMRRLEPRLSGLVGGGRSGRGAADVDPAAGHAPGPSFPALEPAENLFDPGGTPGSGGVGGSGAVGSGWTGPAAAPSRSGGFAAAGSTGPGRIAGPAGSSGTGGFSTPATSARTAGSAAAAGSSGPGGFAGPTGSDAFAAPAGPTGSGGFAAPAASSGFGGFVAAAGPSPFELFAAPETPARSGGFSAAGSGGPAVELRGGPGAGLDSAPAVAAGAAESSPDDAATDRLPRLPRPAPAPVPAAAPAGWPPLDRPPLDRPSSEVSLFEPVRSPHPYDLAAAVPGGPLLAAMVHAEGQRALHRTDLGMGGFGAPDFLHR